VPVQSGPHDLEMTNVVLVMGLKVAKAAVVILDLPLDEAVFDASTLPFQHQERHGLAR